MREMSNYNSQTFNGKNVPSHPALVTITSGSSVVPVLNLQVTTLKCWPPSREINSHLICGFPSASSSSTPPCLLACPVSCLGSQLNYNLSVLKAPITSSELLLYADDRSLSKKLPAKWCCMVGGWVSWISCCLSDRGEGQQLIQRLLIRSLCPRLSADPRSHHTVCMTSANPPTIVGKQKALFNQAPNEVCRAPLTADNVLQPGLQRSDIWTKHYRATVLLIIVTTKSSLVVNKQLLKVLWSRTSSF